MENTELYKRHGEVSVSRGIDRVDDRTTVGELNLIISQKTEYKIPSGPLSHVGYFTTIL